MRNAEKGLRLWHPDSCAASMPPDQITRCGGGKGSPDALVNVLPVQDGDTVNNYVEVLTGTTDPKILESRARLLTEGGTLNSEERELLVKQLDGLDMSL